MLSKSKSKGWKESQSDNESKQRIRLALLVLFFIGIILIFGKGTSLFKTMLNPWGTSPLSYSKNYRWDNQFNINLILQNGKNISLLSYNPGEKTIVELILPNEIYLDVVSGYGKWQLGSVYELGESSNVGGEKLLVNTMTDYLGVPIDGFIQFSGQFDKSTPQDLVTYLRKAPLSIFNTLGSVKTNLSLWELINLKFSLSQVRFDKIDAFNLNEQKILTGQQLPDGTSVLVADPTAIDTAVTGFVDPKVRAEGLSIAVYNATDHPQLAQKAARLIANIGGNVILTANSDQKSDLTYVLGAKSDTAKRLTQVFNSVCLKTDCGKISLGSQGLSSSRAQINIILGEDYYQKFYALRP